MKSHLKQLDYIEMHLERLLNAVVILQSTNKKLLEENKSLTEALREVQQERESEEKQNLKKKESNNTDIAKELKLVKKELNSYVLELDECIKTVQKARI